MVRFDWQELLELFKDKYGRKSGDHLRGVEDETLVVLKAHLLSEEILREFCAVITVRPEILREARLSYKQTMLVAKSFFDEREDWIWTVLSKLNRMRNLMAHSLEPTLQEYESCRGAIINAVLSRSKQSQQNPNKNFKSSLEYALGFLSATCLSQIEILRLSTAISVMNSPPADLEAARYTDLSNPEE